MDLLLTTLGSIHLGGAYGFSICDPRTIDNPSRHHRIRFSSASPPPIFAADAAIIAKSGGWVRIVAGGNANETFFRFGISGTDAHTCDVPCVASTPNTVAVATFEEYGEGSLGTSFTESHSGIVFTDPRYNLGASLFSIEYGSYDPPYNFPMFPGNYLTVAASSPGPDAALGGGASFTATFPFPTTRVEMDVLYISFFSPAALQITGFSSANQQVSKRHIRSRRAISHIYTKCFLHRA